jgi:hypothetical protein
MGNRQSLGLEKLKREFLRQQDISSWKITLGHKAKPLQTLALRAELLDIQHVAAANPIAAAGFPPDDIEISMRVPILTLWCIEMFSKQAQAAAPRALSSL